MTDEFIVDELTIPSCSSPLEDCPPVCEDGVGPCDCDRVYHCEPCEKSWYVSCARHDYGDDELRGNLATN